MNPSVEEYKRFIDDLVKLRPSVRARRVQQGLDYPGFNSFLAELTAEQRENVARMVQEGRDAGIHDVLAYLDERINLDMLRLSRDGVEFAVEPYGTEMYFDWVARCEGDDWPDNQLHEKD